MEIDSNAKKTRERLSVMLAAYKRYQESLGLMTAVRGSGWRRQGLAGNGGKV